MAASDPQPEEDVIDTKTLDEMARKLAEAMPTGMASLQEDIQKTLRAGLEGIFQRLDLVTREEFDVQLAVLARTREKLMDLERRVARLEEIGTGDAPSTEQASTSGPGGE